MSITVRGMNVDRSPRAARILNSHHDVTPPRPNGLKPFEIGKQIVWAFNEKNAKRKAALYPNQEVIGG